MSFCALGAPISLSVGARIPSSLSPGGEAHNTLTPTKVMRRDGGLESAVERKS